MRKKTPGKMRNKIFLSAVTVALAVLLVSVAVIAGVLIGDNVQQARQSLERDAELMAQVYNEDPALLDGCISTATPQRVTLIAPDGTVLYDSHADAAQMENHAERKEVRQALEKGHGYTQRYSGVLGEKTSYAAILLRDGNVLRISEKHLSGFTMAMHLLWPLLLILLGGGAFAFLLSFRLSKTITTPINRIDPEQPEEAQVYEELSPLIDRISEQNRQIAAQMETLKAEHEKQDSTRREFTANVSHELKTPLTSISGYAEIIRNGLVRQEDIPRFAQKIYDESQRLIDLVSDIINLSQLDGQQIPQQPEDIDLYELCREVLSHLELAAQEHHLTLSLQGEHLHITAPRKIAEEMIFNICDNAVKYNKPEGKVELLLRQCVDGVELTVRDTGIGIAQEDLEHIFERFYRADKSHSKEIGGTGLGLSIVKHGALLLNAKVLVDSKVGEGTSVSVLF